MANGNNFVENPGGSGPKLPSPRSFVTPAPGMDRSKPYDGNEENKQDAAPGGRYATMTPQNNPKSDAGNPIGVGSPGGSARPFKLR